MQWVLAYQPHIDNGNMTDYPDEWDEIATYIKERDNHQCAICGATENLSVAHISSHQDKALCEEENLVTLCWSCHCRFDNIYHKPLERKRKDHKKMAKAKFRKSEVTAALIELTGAVVQLTQITSSVEEISDKLSELEEKISNIEAAVIPPEKEKSEKKAKKTRSEKKKKSQPEDVEVPLV
jgi:hypothetical protein